MEHSHAYCKPLCLLLSDTAAQFLLKFDIVVDNVVENSIYEMMAAKAWCSNSC